MFQKTVLGASLILALAFAPNAYAGKVEFTTYYPSAKAEYKDIKTDTLSTGAVQPNRSGDILLQPKTGDPATWPAGTEGQFAYALDGTLGFDALYHYDGGSWIRQGGFLPKTGQTASYQADDDGSYQKGWSGTSRFTDNNDGTITDNATGLMWVQDPAKIIPGLAGVHPTNQIQVPRGDWGWNKVYAKADLVRDTAPTPDTFYVCAVAHTSPVSGTFLAAKTANPTYWRQTVWTASASVLTAPATMNWTTAVTNCHFNLSYAGYDDWRLPNVRELESIIDYGRASPSINTSFFTSKSDVYWSSTTTFQESPFNPQGWPITFNNGFNGSTGTPPESEKTASWYVRPVRNA